MEVKNKGLLTQNLQRLWDFDLLGMKENEKPVYDSFFLDSSLIAYGACVYLKSVTKSGKIHLLLLASKSRIVPAKKKFTIPKLELLGNFILSNLINVVYNGFFRRCCCGKLWISRV